LRFQYENIGESLAISPTADSPILIGRIDKWIRSMFGIRRRITAVVYRIAAITDLPTSRCRRFCRSRIDCLHEPVALRHKPRHFSVNVAMWPNVRPYGTIKIETFLIPWMSKDSIQSCGASTHNLKPSAEPADLPSPKMSGQRRTWSKMRPRSNLRGDLEDRQSTQYTRSTPRKPLVRDLGQRSYLTMQAKG
jgi:hypothetical protein